MALTRLRMDELVNAWVSDENTPFQIALLGTFHAGPFRRPDGTVDVPRIRGELAARAHRVPALGRRVVWTRLGEGRPVWAADPAFAPAGHVGSATLPPGADLERAGQRTGSCGPWPRTGRCGGRRSSRA
jgi:diacylglycerol O-acyltransferase / wax synthase